MRYIQPGYTPSTYNTPLAHLGGARAYLLSHAYGQLVSIARSAMNCFPCSGLVMMLTNICAVGKCLMTISPSSTRSLSQKCRMAMCRVFCDAGPPRLML